MRHCIRFVLGNRKFSRGRLCATDVIYLPFLRRAIWENLGRTYRRAEYWRICIHLLLLHVPTDCIKYLDLCGRTDPGLSLLVGPAGKPPRAMRIDTASCRMDYCPLFACIKRRTKKRSWAGNGWIIYFKRSLLKRWSLSQLKFQCKYLDIFRYTSGS